LQDFSYAQNSLCTPTVPPRVSTPNGFDEGLHSIR